MSILLVRHGETQLNAARVVQPMDTPLSDRGRAQADAVAARLAKGGVKGILSSDMPRALETAQRIALAAGCPITTSTLLHERNFGAWRGRAYDTLGFDPTQRDDAPEGGESTAVFRERVLLAFAELLGHRAALEGNLVVVTHGLVIRTILAELVSLPDELRSPERVANTSVTIFSAQPPHPVIRLNNHDHLTGELGDDVRSLSGL